MKTLSIFIALVFVTGSSFAKDIAGEWNGLLNVQGLQIRLVFHISKTEDGFTALLDSPDQGAKGIPANSVKFVDDQLEIRIDVLGAVYEGTVISDENINGTFKQAGQSFDLNLAREYLAKKVLNRPQEPSLPYPYNSEEVSIKSVEGVQLAGTFTTPTGVDSFPVVILISGSGPQNRDEEFMTHKPFLVLADHLTKKGIGVLRYDDRGTAKSTGTFYNATSEDFAIDVESVIKYLKINKSISKIGLIGHSEGGLIAPMVAAESEDVGFAVLLAGPGLPGDQVLLKQHEMLARIQGKSQEEIEFGVSSAKKAFELVKTSENTEDLKKSLNQYLTSTYDHPLATIPEGMKKEDLIKMEINQLSSPWMRFFLRYHPAESLKKVKCPLLALNGEKDVQVSVDNLEYIKNAVHAGGNQNITIVKYPDMNHLFQKCTTGALAEYATIEQTIDPTVLDDISDWILKQ